jgi:hypothetical protein
MKNGIISFGVVVATVLFRFQVGGYDGRDWPFCPTRKCQKRRKKT